MTGEPQHGNGSAPAAGRYRTEESEKLNRELKEEKKSADNLKLQAGLNLDNGTAERL
ncbi:MAG TPA: hypothetical protein VFG09_07570 [Thermodesulfovibrionales bacterium]|nr:hypothetical protein [Thermodesulfovibrionales bacterium]